MSNKMKALAAGALGIAFLCGTAAPAFAATGPEQDNTVAQQGLVNIAPQVAPQIAPQVAPVVAPLVAPVVTPAVAPAVALAPIVHPAIGGSH